MNCTNGTTQSSRLASQMLSSVVEGRHQFGGCTKLQYQYRLIGKTLLECEHLHFSSLYSSNRENRSSKDDNKNLETRFDTSKIQEFFNENVRFIPIEVLSFYLEDILDKEKSDEYLHINQKCFFRKLFSCISCIPCFFSRDSYLRNTISTNLFSKSIPGKTSGANKPQSKKSLTKAAYKADTTHSGTIPLSGTPCLSFLFDKILLLKITFFLFTFIAAVFTLFAYFLNVQPPGVSFFTHPFQLLFGLASSILPTMNTGSQASSFVESSTGHYTGSFFQTLTVILSLTTLLFGSALVYLFFRRISEGSRLMSRRLTLAKFVYTAITRRRGNNETKTKLLTFEGFKLQKFNLDLSHCCCRDIFNNTSGNLNEISL
jgi:hypothetical protein